MIKSKTKTTKTENSITNAKTTGKKIESLGPQSCSYFHFCAATGRATNSPLLNNHEAGFNSVLVLLRARF